MKYRCDHSKGCYKDVSYCDRWKNFENFFSDMGERPEGMSLDRIDPKGNYNPENCRWADMLVQQNNRRNNVFYEISGKKLTLNQIARTYEISRSNLSNKIYIYGWNMQDAIDYLVARKGERTYR